MLSLFAFVISLCFCSVCTGGCSFSLDPNTANQHVRLSNDAEKATWVPDPVPYQGHDGRFDKVPQVLCTEPLPQRIQVEVEFTNAVVAVAYGSMKRKGDGDDVLFGNNDKSWCVGYDSGSNRYFASHNNTKELISAPPAGSRVLVFLDRDAHTLEFLTFTPPQSLESWYKFKPTFTEEDLYMGFRVPSTGSSATLTFSYPRLLPSGAQTAA
ncbi:tripartite motif-containing protein 14-like isoform X1 [Sardina pilchardus]|uniref:tripartite motif-containing protein 14-like isoform X1 n=1 Tax=Sardina pilchardus TaxID=27697 RepID=UPI002E141E3A